MYFRIVLCAATIALAQALAGPSAADAHSLDAAFSQSYREIDALARAKDKAGLLAMAAELERTWKRRSLDHYGKLMSRICGALRSDLAFDDIPFDEITSLAIRALASTNTRDGGMTVETKYGLLLYVDGPTELSEEEDLAIRAATRRAVATAWLSAWSQLTYEWDANWDPDDVPEINVQPPSGAFIESGAAPGAIDDPKLRAEYERRIEANRQKAAYQSHQHTLRKLKEPLRRALLDFVGKAYALPPDADAELQALLEEYIDDPELRAQILDAVAAGKAQAP